MAKSPKPPTHRMMRYMSMGIELMVIFGLWMLLGWWLDGRWGTSPALMLVGAVVGFGLGMYRLVRDAHRAFRDAMPPTKDDAGTRGRGDAEK